MEILASNSKPDSILFNFLTVSKKYLERFELEFAIPDGTLV